MTWCLSLEHFIWDVLRLSLSFDQFFPKNREIFRDPRVISSLLGSLPVPECAPDVPVGEPLPLPQPLKANGAARVEAAPQF